MNTHPAKLQPHLKSNELTNSMKQYAEDSSLLIKGNSISNCWKENAAKELMFSKEDCNMALQADERDLQEAATSSEDSYSMHITTATQSISREVSSILNPGQRTSHINQSDTNTSYA